MNKAEYDEYLKSEHWQQTREKAKELLPYKCAVCGEIKKLHLHHLTYERIGHENIETDLQWLCPKHHKQAHDEEEGDWTSYKDKRIAQLRERLRSNRQLRRRLLSDAKKTRKELRQLLGPRRKKRAKQVEQQSDIKQQNAHMRSIMQEEGLSDVQRFQKVMLEQQRERFEDYWVSKNAEIWKQEGKGLCCGKGIGGVPCFLVCPPRVYFCALHRDQERKRR